MLVDSHCHLQADRFDEDREAVIERALADLDWFVVIGDDLPTSEAALALCRNRFYATVGVHPYYAATVDDHAIDRLRAMSREDCVVAIGEIGLDYFKYNDTPRDVQQRAFRKQLDLAVELELPVVIHNRESTDDLVSILAEYADRLVGGVMHCYAGPPAFAEEVLRWGFCVSFAGNVTFPKAVELQAVAKTIPLDRLLVETDAPYLAPQAVRGKRCEPQFVAHTATFLANLRGEDEILLRDATARNAARLFGIEQEAKR